MPPLTQFMRYDAGRLAAMASLLLLAACQTSTTSQPVPRQHDSAAMLASGGPFEQVFNSGAELVVLTFFDLYCVACQQSAENFSQLHAEIIGRYPDRTVQMTGIGVGDTEFEIDVFTRRYPLPYPSIADPQKAFEKPFSIRGTPTVLVFSRKGTNCLEIFRHEGRFRSNNLQELLETIDQTVSGESN